MTTEKTTSPLKAATIATLITGLLVGGAGLAIINVVKSKAAHQVEAAEQNATIKVEAAERIADNLKKEHAAALAENEERMKDQSRRDGLMGYRLAMIAKYENDVADCMGTYTGEALDQCVIQLQRVAPDEGVEKLAARGYVGQVFLEETYKTREAAVKALAKSGWEESDAKKDGTSLIWEQDYPRTMKLVETKTSWAWIGVLADIPQKAK